MSETGKLYLIHLVTLAEFVRAHLKGADFDKEMLEELAECDRLREEIMKSTEKDK